MRKVIEPPRALGQVDIADIVFNPKSRDDIPRILRGLQHLYVDPVLRQRVFSLLEEVLPDRIGAPGKACPDIGRPGMAQWTILVLGVLRLGLNANYDRIHELANEHATLRQMLGVGDWDEHVYFELQTLKDNLRLFTPELLDRINQEVVRAGHHALKKARRMGSTPALTPSWWRRMSNTPPIPACSTRPSARRWGWVPSWPTPMGCPAGGRLPTTCAH